MARCSREGGCPSDYIALSVAIVSFILLLTKWALPYLIHRIPRSNGSSFWLVAIQLIASFNLLLSIVMALNFLKLRKEALVEILLSLGRRQMPPVRSYIFLPVIMLPWIAGAAFMHMEKPLNYHCHMGARWIIPVMCLHAMYVAALVGFARAVHHVEFRFHELKDLWRGILVSISAIGMWVIAYVLNEIHEDIALLQVASRFMLLVMTSILVVAFFSVSMSQPLVSLMSLRKKDHQGCKTMGHALGIPDSGFLSQSENIQVIDPNEPLDKLLLDRKFRQSFMEFADSCLAGESVHFYDEVQQLDKILDSDPIRRIYMARHIIEKYIATGARMEVNISHRCRQEILSSPDLAHPNLFKSAINELMQLMKMNLAKDYWSSTFFLKLKEERGGELMAMISNNSMVGISLRG